MTEPKTRQVAAQVTPGLFGVVQAAAETDGLKMSDVVRLALMRYLHVNAAGEQAAPNPFLALRGIELAEPAALDGRRKSTRGKAGS